VTFRNPDPQTIAAGEPQFLPELGRRGLVARSEHFQHAIVQRYIAASPFRLTKLDADNASIPENMRPLKSYHLLKTTADVLDGDERILEWLRYF